MNDIYYFTPLHHKFIKFDDITWLAIILLILVSVYFVTKFNVRSKH